MDIGALTNIIQAVGFPIAMCMVFCYYIKYQDDKNREEIDKINAEHKEEVSYMTETLANNTAVLIELKTLMQEIVLRLNKEE